MAELAGLNVVLTGDASNLTRELNNTQKTLAKTAIEAGKLDSKLSKDLSQGSNTAGQSLMNLGRIAQDAPFGFIGIQNNINPLLESFTRLKAETGSVKGAFSALASSLMGGAGLGLAVSLATSALTILTQQGFFKNTDEVKKNDEAVKTIGSTYDLFLQQIENVSKSMAEESAKVSLLAFALEDANTSALQRKNIIEELNSISPGYLGDLDKERASYEQISKAVFDYTESLAKSVEIKALLPEFEKLIQKIIKTQVELNQLRRIGTDDKNIFGLPVDEFNKEQARLLGIIKGTTNEVNFAKKALADIAGSGISLSEILFGKKVDKSADKEKSVKDIRTIQDVINELRLKIKELNTEEFTLNTDKAQERVSAFLSAIKELAVKFKLDPQGKIIQGLFDESKFAKLGFIVENEFAKLGVAGVAAFKAEMASLKMDEVVPIGFEMQAIEKGIVGKPDIKNFSISQTSVKQATALAYLKGKGITKGMQDGISVGISALRFPELIELANSYKAQLDKFNESTINLTNQMLVSTFSAIGDALTNAVSGMSVGDIFAGFFKSILGALGSGLQQLGAQLLMANIAIQTAKKTLGKLPGIGAAVSMIAIGAIVKGLANNIKLPGFANGVQNFAGGLAMVGERGPELVRLPGGSDVIPNHALGGMSLGGGSQVFIPAVTLRGKDLIVAFNRANQTINRQS